MPPFNTPSSAASDWRSQAVPVDPPAEQDRQNWRRSAEILPPSQGQVTPPSHSNVPPDLANYVAQQGLPDEMLDMGVTPGNAARWADLHIQQTERELGTRLDPSRQQAIFDIYKELGGRDDLSRRNFQMEQAEQSRQERVETPLGRAQNIGLNALEPLGQLATGAISAVNPELGNELAEDSAAFLNPNRDSLSGTVGRVVGEGAKLGGIIGTGGALGAPAATMAGIYGLQGFGGSRGRAEQLRDQGEDISQTEEFGTAAASGAVEGLSGFVGAKLFGSMANQLGRLSPGIRAAFQQGGAQGGRAAVKNAVRQSARLAGTGVAEGTEEALTELALNKITQVGMDPDQAIMEGLGEAFAMGLILSPVGAASVQSLQSGQQAQQDGETLAPQVDDLIRDEGQQPQDQQQNLPESPRFIAGEGGTLDRRNPPPEQEQRQLPAGQTAQGLPATPEQEDTRFVGGEQGALIDREAEPVRTEEPDPAPAPRVFQEQEAAVAEVQDELQRRTRDEEVQALMARDFDRDEAIEMVFGDVPRVEQGEGVLEGSFVTNFRPEAPPAREQSQVQTRRAQPQRQTQQPGRRVTPDDALDPETRQLKDQIQQAVGPDTTVQVGETPNRAQGVYNPEDQTVTVRPDMPDAMANSLVHEAFHATGLDVNAKIGNKRELDRLEREYISDMESFAKRNPDNQNIQRALDAVKNDPAARRREATATLAGNLAADPEFAKQMANRHPSLVDRLIDTVKSSVERLTGKYGDASKRRDARKAAQALLSKIQKNTGRGQDVQFKPGDEAPELQNSWVAPSGEVIPAPIRQHESVAREQLDKLGIDHSKMDTDEAFKTLMDEGWVRVQSEQGGRRGGWNIAARKMTPESRDTVTAMSDQALGTAGGINIVAPNTNGLQKIDFDNQERLLRSVETKFDDDDDDLDFRPPSRESIQRDRAESLQREIAELTGKRSRATSQTKKEELTDLIEQRRKVIEKITTRPDRPQSEGVMFMPPPRTESKGKKLKSLPRMTSVDRLVAMARDGESGRMWYARAEQEVRQAASQLGLETKEFADMLALFSPRVPVKRNINLAIHYARARNNGVTDDSRFRADVLPTVRTAVAHWEKTGEIRGPKTGPFADAITGDSDAVVLDVWMAKALGVDQKLLATKGTGGKADQRIRDAAKKLGWTPAEAQAAVWTSAVKQQRKNPGQFHIGNQFTASEHAEMVARDYAIGKGIKLEPTASVERMPEQTARDVADAYHQAIHEPDNPDVKAAYDAFKQETMEQFEALQAAGFEFRMEPLEDVAKRYPTAQALIDAVEKDRVVYTADDPGDMPADHPLMEEVEGMDGWTYNHVFRSVHDVMGHVRAGVEFDILGEENAWRSHSQMYTPAARGALATETRAQSSWVGYGPNAPGNLEAIAENDIGRVVFPPQKATLIPDEFHTPNKPEDPGTVQFRPPETRKPGVTPSKGRYTLPQGIEDFVAPISTRIRNISPKIHKRLQQFEMRSRVQREDLQRATSEFLRAKNKSLSKEQQRKFTLLTANGDFDAVRDMLRSVDSAMVRQFNEVTNILDSIHAAAQRAGIDVGFRENYWPRQVKDYKRWRKEKKGDEPGVIKDAIKDAEKRRGRKLTTGEEYEVANSVLQGYGPRKPGGQKPAAFRDRILERISESDLDLYADSDQAIMDYINRATTSIEKARFFGKGPVEEDILDSVGRYVADQVKAGDITGEQERTLFDLLSTRFTTGEAAPSGWIRTMRDVGYITVLANPISAATQIGDLFLAAYRSGIVNGVSAAASKKKIKMETLGIERMAAEFTNPSSLSKLLDTAMAASGFKSIDRLGKETLLNASIRKYQRAARNPKSKAAQDLEREYGDVYGDEFSALKADLAAGTVSENVRLLVFMDLASVQPISLSEMPQKYLAAPNGRIFFMLKTFTIKQLDLIRNQSVRRINQGDVAGGASDFVRYAMIFGLGNTGADILKDWLLNRDIEWSDLAIDGILRLIGGNKFLLDSAAKDGPGTAFFNMLMPPTNVLDDAARDALNTPEIWSGEKGVSSLRNIPGFGKVLYWRAGEGARRLEQDARTEARKRKSEVRDHAVAALDTQDVTSARAMVEKWNTEEKEPWQEKLTLKSVSQSRRSRRTAAFSQAREEAAEALLSDNSSKAQEIIDKFNKTDHPRTLNMQHVQGTVRRLRARGRTAE